MDYNNQLCRANFTQGQGQRMLFFLQHVRSTLLESKGCLPPCQEQLQLEATTIPDSLFLGDSIEVSLVSDNSDSIVWFINDRIMSNSIELEFKPEFEGLHRLEIHAYDLTNLCDSVVLSFPIEVI